MAQIDVRGDIVSNDDKWMYDWFDYESTSPSDIKNALESKPEGETLEVLVNSGGGDVLAGQEIYSMLAGRDDVVINIQSMAGSAASIIAMSNLCEISPVAMLMIHNVSMYGASGDYHDMKKNAEILQQMNSALAQAYVSKTGMSEEKVLQMMDRETWITANQALELGFVDSISNTTVNYTNAIGGMRLTDEMRKQAMAERDAQNKRRELANNLLADLDQYGRGKE